MKIIITGANGMLGSSLCKLYNNDHEIYALHRDKTCYVNCLKDYSVDLTNEDEVGEIIYKIKPDLLIHCASMTNLEECEKYPDLAMSINTYATENIARLCSNRIKLVYISTDQIYGDTEYYTESNRVLKPINEYGRTKLLGEKKVEKLCSNHIITRTNIFGWNIKPNKISSAEWIYNSLKNNQEITLFCDYTFSPMYSIYFGEIIMLLVKINLTGTINVGSPINCSKFDFGNKLAELYGFNKSNIKKGTINDHFGNAKRNSKLDLDCTKLTSIEPNILSWEKSLELFVNHNYSLHK